MASSGEDPLAPETRSMKPFVEDAPEDANVSESDPPPPVDPRRTEDSYREIKRIMDSSDFYTILDLEKDFTAPQLKNQYWKLAKLTHPDKTKWPDAELAFKKLSTAHAVLVDPSERRSYDKAPERYTPPDPVERPFGEEFADNAFGGGDSDSEPGDEGSEDEKPATLRPNEAIRAIYRAATPLIQGILGDPPSAREKPSIMKEVNKFNLQIKAQNKKDGLDDKNLGQFLIQYTIFESNALLARPHWEKLKNDPHDSAALKEMEKIEKTLKSVIKKNDYDSGWCYEALGFKPKDGGSPSPAQQKKGKGGDSATTGKSGSAQENTVAMFKPGYTLTGEKIIAMLPRERTVRRMGEDGVRGPPEKIITGYQFIVKDEDEDLIELVSGEEIGRKATSGYLSLPKDQIVDARYSEKRVTQEDAEHFESLIDFTAKPFNMRSSDTPRHPTGYGLVLFKDGTEEVLNRTALRKMLGPTDADFEIQECEKRNGKIPPWKIEPLGWREPRKMVIEKPTERRRRRELNHDDPTKTESEGLFVPKDRRATRLGSRSNSRSNFHSAKNVESETLKSEVADMRKDLHNLTQQLTNLLLTMANAGVSS